MDSTGNQPGLAAGFRLLALLALSLSLVAHAQQDSTLAFALADEAAAKIQERCFYPRTAAAVYAGILAAAHKRSGDAQFQPGGMDQLPQAEAAQQFRARIAALAEQPGQRLELLDLVEGGLADYCRSIDHWSRYLSIQDAARISQFKRTDAIGIGVNLREDGGSVFCHPFPESQAGLAGITSGDKLLTVDGRAVDGQPLELIAAWIKGVPGTKTTLRVEKLTGQSQLITATRESAKMPLVLIEKERTGTLVKIRHFENGAANQIAEALKDLQAGRAITFDLRGCGGGWMLTAVEIARLFVAEGKTVLTHIERGGEGEVFTAPGAKFSPGRITILQDEGTGSAAEILIAALVENLPQQAVSRGQQTHGKGVVQEPILLKSGGQIILTTGILFGPSGRSWEGVGLLPSFDAKEPGGIYPPNARSLPRVVGPQ